MISKMKKIIEDIRGGLPSTPDERNDNIVLEILAKKKIIAYLSTENNGEQFTLRYTEHFKESGIPPFNMKYSDMDKVEIGKVYKSKVLWNEFAMRVPNPSRPDFDHAIKSRGLTGNESVLELIGKMSQVSISKPWTIEIAEQKGKNSPIISANNRGSIRPRGGMPFNGKRSSVTNSNDGGVIVSDVHVVPSKSGWAVKADGCIISVHGTQEEARQSAVVRAKLSRSEVVIHGRDGKMRSKLSYGNNPYYSSRG